MADADAPTLGESVRGDPVSLHIWKITDAESLRSALAVSDDAFRDWLPGVFEDTRDVPRFLRSVGELFQTGAAFLYAVVVGDAVVGQCSLHPKDAREGVIGYWVRTDRTGEGIATMAVRLLASAALAHGFERLELRCDEGNVRSAAVATRAGFSHVATVDVAGPRTAAQTGREMIWERLR